MLTNPGPQRGRRHGAAVACHFAAAAQEDHGWYRLNMKARGELPFRIGIDFGQPHMWLELLRGSFKHRRHCAARPTPRRPKIYQQR